MTPCLAARQGTDMEQHSATAGVWPVTEMAIAATQRLSSNEAMRGRCHGSMVQGKMAHLLHPYNVRSDDKTRAVQGWMRYDDGRL